MPGSAASPVITSAGSVMTETDLILTWFADAMRLRRKAIKAGQIDIALAVQDMMRQAADLNPQWPGLAIKPRNP